MKQLLKNEVREWDIYHDGEWLGEAVASSESSAKRRFVKQGGTYRDGMEAYPTSYGISRAGPLEI